MRERYCLAMERIKEIHNEKLVREPFLDYFWSMASFLEQMDDLIENGQKKRTKEYNEGLYQDILPGHYEKSYASPEMANALLGKKYGPYLSFLYTQLRGIIPFAYESFQIPEKIMDITILLEAFLEVYCAFTTEEQEGNLPAPETIGQILYWFLSDYADEIIPERIKEQLDPDCDFAKKIILNADLSDPSYLYQINGEYHSIVDIEKDAQIVIFSDVYANIRTFFLDTLQFYNIKRMDDQSLLDKFLEKQIELDGGLE